MVDFGSIVLDVSQFPQKATGQTGFREDLVSDSGGVVSWSRHDAELLEEAQHVLV